MSWSHTAWPGPMGQITVITEVDNSQITLKFEYPKPFDRPQIKSTDQDPRGLWLHDHGNKSRWKFMMEKTPNMTSNVVGMMIDPAVDEKFIRVQDNLVCCQTKRKQIQRSIVSSMD